MSEPIKEQPTPPANQSGGGTPPAPVARESAKAADEAMVRTAIKDLKFQTKKKIEKEGESPRYVPSERPMTMRDVLSWSRQGKRLVVVTADGRKHRFDADE